MTPIASIEKRTQSAMIGKGRDLELDAKSAAAIAAASEKAGFPPPPGAAAVLRRAVVPTSEPTEPKAPAATGAGKTKEG